MRHLSQTLRKLRGVRDDVSDLSPDEVQQAAGVGTANRSLIEDYSGVRIELHIHIITRGIDEKEGEWCIVLQSLGQKQTLKAHPFYGIPDRRDMGQVVPNVNRYSYQEPMFVDVLKFSQAGERTAKGRIRSVVWLESLNQCARNAADSCQTVGADRVLEVSRTRRDRKSNRTLRRKRNGTSEIQLSQPEDEIVKRGTQIVETIADQTAEGIGKTLLHNTVVGVLGTIVIGLSPHSVRTDARGLDPDLGVEKIKVFIRPAKTHDDSTQLVSHSGPVLYAATEDGAP